MGFLNSVSNRNDFLLSLKTAGYLSFCDNGIFKTLLNSTSNYMSS